MEAAEKWTERTEGTEVDRSGQKCLECTVAAVEFSSQVRAWHRSDVKARLCICYMCFYFIDIKLAWNVGYFDLMLLLTIFFPLLLLIHHLIGWTLSLLHIVLRELPITAWHTSGHTNWVRGWALDPKLHPKTVSGMWIASPEEA